MRTISVILFIAFLQLPQDKEFEKLHGRIVSEQIERRGVRDSATLASMRKVQRHLFEPENQTENVYGRPTLTSEFWKFKDP